MNPQVMEVIKNSAAVPTVPQIITRVLQVMSDPDFDYSDVVKAVSTDAGAVSEILRLANSALFGVRKKVVSLRQALTLLGPKRTRSMLLGRYLVDSLNVRAIDGVDMGYFWRRSLTAAVLSSNMAGAVAPKIREECFISALLADIGMIVLAQALPDRYGPVIAQHTANGKPITREKELEAVSATHPEVSAMILGHWSLPDTITTAVNLHHGSNPGDSEAGSIARIITAADMIARLLCEVPDTTEIGPACTAAAALARIDLAALATLLTSVENEIEELADILKIDVIQSNVYALIATTVQESLAAPAAGT